MLRTGDDTIRSIRNIITRISWLMWNWLSEFFHVIFLLIIIGNLSFSIISLLWFTLPRLTRMSIITYLHGFFTDWPASIVWRSICVSFFMIFKPKIQLFGLNLLTEYLHRKRFFWGYSKLMRSILLWVEILVIRNWMKWSKIIFFRFFRKNFQKKNLFKSLCIYFVKIAEFKICKHRCNSSIFWSTNSLNFHVIRIIRMWPYK